MDERMAERMRTAREAWKDEGDSLPKLFEGTPLHEAVDQGDLGRVTALLEEGADVNARDSTGHTPLHTAAMMGRAASVRLLLARGADPSALDKSRQDPLGLARMGKADQEVIQLLTATLQNSKPVPSDRV